MVSESATSLRDSVARKLQELGEALDGIDEVKAGRRPSQEEWCCKEVLSHLMGDEGEDLTEPFRRMMAEETTLIGIVTGLPYYTLARQAMSMAEMRAAVWKRYEELGEFLGSLSDEQLARKARVPLFKDAPFGEFVDVGQFMGALTFHLTDHTSQIRAQATEAR